jgi:hypothetical protein
MDALQVRSLLAGLCFGIWPLLMQRSGLTGNFSSFVFTAIVLVCVTPFTFGNVGSLTSVNWGVTVAAGIFSSIGVMSFNGMLAKATPQNVSSLFVLMIVVQVSIPAIYSVTQNGGMFQSRFDWDQMYG